MRRIAYAEAVIGTDGRIADLVVEYAGLLASGGAAATVVIPAVVDGGALRSVTLLLGPASQMAAWSDDEPFPGDPAASVADLQQKIDRLVSGGPSEEMPPFGDGEFDDLDPADPDRLG